MSGPVRKNIATRYKRKEEPAEKSGHESHNLTSTHRNNESRVGANKNKKRGLPDSVHYQDYNTAAETLEGEKNYLQKELAEQQKKCANLTSALQLKEKENTSLKQSNNDLQKKVEESNTELTELSKTNEKKITSLKKENEKLKKKKSSLESDIRKLKVQKEKKEKLLETARKSCKEIFNLKVHSNFAQTNSNLITDIVKLYESCSHGDKIQHCPAIQYKNSVPESTTSSRNIEDVSNNGPPLKKRKMDSKKGIDKHYSKESLKELVMNLERRHSDKYDLWRNVLWALNQYGREQGYDTLAIADSFSQRSSKYKNLRDVKETFDSSNGTLSLHYLIEISKIYEEELDAMTEYLSTILPSTYLPVTINQVDIIDRRKFRLNVNYADESHTLLIIPDLCSLFNEDGKRLCFLAKTFKSDDLHMSSFCPEMEKGFVVTLNMNNYVFKARNYPSVTVKLNYPLKSAESFVILPNGKQSNKELHLTKIRQALRAESLKLLSEKSGKKFGDDQDDNNMLMPSVEDPNMIRTDDELIEALYDADPEMMSRYQHSRKIIYHCKPGTNLWCELNEATFDSHLRRILRTTLKLTQAELKHINMSYAIVKIRNVTFSYIENTDFPDLDSNLHLFITKNKTIDASSIPPIIRNIDKEDLAETTCGWSYNYELSIKYMSSVQSYFDKLIPQPMEREWFLSFVAKMLNGRRMDEFFFLVLHGKRQKKNGISTLMSLLATVFGNYFISNTKIVVGRGTRDNDQYDGGIYNLKGKRLLVANKLQRADTLNCAFITAITGQSNHYIQDKRKFSRAEIKFPVQAGLIMAFTEEDEPKFDKTNQDFVERMAACPMRSRFLTTQEIDQLRRNGEKMTNIHIADDSLKRKFPEWRSALLDLLRKYYNESLPPIPDSMVDCKKRLCDVNYNYYDWLDSHVRKDDDNYVFITAKDVMRIIDKSKEFNPQEMNKLKTVMSAWADKNDFRWKDRHVYQASRTNRVEAKSAIMNAVLHNINEE